MRSLFRSLKEPFLRSWWVVLFTLFCYIAYEQSLKWQQRDFAALSAQVAALRYEQQNGLKQQAELLRQIQSQNDPAWVELVLMKELGLTPEGQTKVLFR
jgi:hypothetical protein